jgi:uncharacterized damage-inducible protein DinB
MQTIEHLRELFRYNNWANRRIIAALKENDCERSRAIFAHLVTTEQEYFERLPGKDSTGFNFWPDLTIGECEELAEAAAGRFRGLLEEMDEDDLARVSQYKSSVGVGHKNDYRELLTHVIIHSSIHRGNIIIKLRESGFEPPEIDYIIFLREA